MSKPFLINKNQAISYNKLIKDIGGIREISEVIYYEDIYSILKNVVACLYYNSSVTIIDSDLSDAEVYELGFTNEKLNASKKIPENEITFEKFIRVIRQHINDNFPSPWKITLFTSGTTGQPKRVTHTFKSMNRYIKVSEKHRDDVWALAYNPTHIAGLQVLFQALLNINTIHYVFDSDRKNVIDTIEKGNITHISATPTFYRLLLPYEKPFGNVKRVTSGGEKLNSDLLRQLKEVFPNAKILNTYASTESGTLFAADGEYFHIPHHLKSEIKIVDNEVFIHKNISAIQEGNEKEWYSTGDLVEFVDDNRFKIISRKNDEINVGGYKVNLLEIEEKLLAHPDIYNVVVHSKSNSILGNIITAEAVLKPKSSITEKDIRKYLSRQLQDYKIPRIIKFVDGIERSRTGKAKRNYD